MEIESFFYVHPVFSYEEFAQWKQSQGPSNLQAIRDALKYHTQTGRLLNVRRGLYAVVPPTDSPETAAVDAYLLAAKVTSDSVLGYHTALELHGIAYSVFEKFTFLTSQKSKSFEFCGQWFQPVSIPKALTKQNYLQDVQTINRQGVEIQMTTLARTFVDVLDRIELSGGWEEVVRSISNIAVLNVNEVIVYCLLLNNRRLAAKVGFFLEQRQGAFAVSDKELAPLLQLKPLSPQYLASQRGETCRYIKKWNLLIPQSVLDRSWEEPDHAI